ncbi:3'-5' exonuclease [Anaerotalea alkaliphila]|uniref:3'-5' exonuclease n=1 Tax=Anaerotalea alkaliphila TaxID=2662126 RepID=A0A7X5KNH1_9FIRM|nr:3'-5' exonuclease [Anaerotalea alkaliphila]NDL66752.1 3'-5' exonuclease [Anaerotalea alkaliphila]
MKDYTCVDLETTGIHPAYSKITEIGMVKVRDGAVIATYSRLVNPGIAIPPEITRITGIDDAMVAGEPPLEAVLGEVLEFCGMDPLLGHNILFDYGFLKTHLAQAGVPFERNGLDTLALARRFGEGKGGKSLSALCDAYHIHRKQAHRALEDALATHTLYGILRDRHFSQTTASYFVPRPLQYRPRKEQPITDRQRRYLLALLDRYPVRLSEPLEKMTKSEASRQIDRILFEFGRNSKE